MYLTLCIPPSLPHSYLLLCFDPLQIFTVWCLAVYKASPVHSEQTGSRRIICPLAAAKPIFINSESYSPLCSPWRWRSLRVFLRMRFPEKVALGSWALQTLLLRHGDLSLARNDILLKLIIIYIVFSSSLFIPSQSIIPIPPSQTNKTTQSKSRSLLKKIGKGWQRPSPAST